MKGVTQNVYNAWRASQGQPAADVKRIIDAEVAAIYSNNYWKKALCNVLQSHIDLVQFDTAVNMGPVRAVKMLQQAVGVGVDGNFGQETQKACDACSPPDTVARYCSIREALYRRFAQAPGQDRFLVGIVRAIFRTVFGCGSFRPWATRSDISTARQRSFVWS